MLLRNVFANPGDEQARMVYADWLEDRDDPRAAYVRLDPRVGRLSMAEDEPLQEQRRALASRLDPEWVALFDVLSCPFEPFVFSDAFGPPHVLPEQLPFTQPLGTRGPVLTFASSLRQDAEDEGLARDLALLTSLELDECAYGPASLPVHPFLCDLPGEGPLTEERLLEVLGVRSFWPEGDEDGSFPDSLHRDFYEQHLFQHHEEDYQNSRFEILSPDKGVHGQLLRHVDDGLWYVLLHTSPLEPDHGRGHYVILLAVGASRSGERLLGAIGHQRCYNLCD